MSSAQKSYLIDSTQFQSLMKQADHDTPKAMGKVFINKSAPKEKFYQYSKLYSKCIDDAAFKRRPLEIVESAGNADGERGGTHSPMRKMMRLPKSYINKGRQIYGKLTHSNDINWDDTGVYIKRKLIGSKDIFDYIQMYTSKQKNIKEKGFKEFKTFLDNYLITQSGAGACWMKYTF